MPGQLSRHARQTRSLSPQERRLLVALATLAQPSTSAAIWKAIGLKDPGSLQRLVQKRFVLRQNDRYRLADRELRSWLLRDLRRASRLYGVVEYGYPLYVVR